MSDPADELDVPSEVRPVGTHAIAPATLAMLVIILLLGTVSSAYRLMHRERATVADVDLSVPDWRPSPTERVTMARAEDARRRPLTPEATEAAKALIRTFEAFNTVDLAHGGDRRSPAIADAHADYRQRALDFRAHHGDEAYMALGQTQLDRFRSALRSGQAEEIKRVSGSYYHALEASRLTTPEGKAASKSSELVATIGFLIQWCRAVIEVRPVDVLVDATSREVMLRWKLAANPLTPEERQQEVARLLVDLGSQFPVFEALAARAAASGRWQRAADLYEQAAELPGADHRQLRANAALARARSAGKPSQSASQP